MDAVIQKAYEAAMKGQSYAFATVVDSTIKGTPRKEGAKLIVLADGTSVGTIGGGRNEKAAIEECKKALKTGKATTVRYDYFGQKGQSVCGGQIHVFIEPFAQQKHFVLCGGGHIALPLSFLAKLLNFKLTVIDDRKAFANKKRFAHADAIKPGDYPGALNQISIDENTYVMVVTRGNEYDFECLKTVITSNAAYIGVISSKAKRIKFFKRLKDMGINEKYLKRVKIPAGLDIGAQTPEEIAISILAEVIKEYNKKFLNSAKFKEKRTAK